MARTIGVTDPLLTRLAGWTALAAATELAVLRIGTRTFIHIPGVDVLTGPLSVMAEAGRLSFYLTVVLVLALAVRLITVLGRDFRPGHVFPISALTLVLFASGLAAAKLAFPQPVGWMSLGAVGLAATAAISQGRRALPLVLWATAVGIMATQMLLQGPDGSLASGQVRTLARSGEVLAIAATASLPLLLGERLSRNATLVGTTVAALVAALFWASSSTTTILALWSIGLPGSLPAVAYGVGAGAVTATIWAAWRTGRPLLAAAAALLAAGGFGLISTYQTTLVVTGLALAATGISRQADKAATRETPPGPKLLRPAP